MSPDQAYTFTAIALILTTFGAGIGLVVQIVLIKWLRTLQKRVQELEAGR